MRLNSIHALIAITLRRQQLHRDKKMNYAEDLQMRKTSALLARQAQDFVYQMTRFQYWYIGSPYSAQTEKTRKRRYEAVAEITNKLYDRGITCWSPIATWHPLEKLHDRIRPPAEYTMLNDTMLFRSRGLIAVQLPGHEHSTGLLHERRRALEWKLPTIDFSVGPYFKDPDELINTLLKEIDHHESL